MPRREALMPIAALLIALAGFAASAWVSAAVYERIPHIEDEMAYAWQARLIAQHLSLTVPSPPCPKCFLYPFVVDYNGVRFGKYPPGWPALLAIGEFLSLRWLVNPILAGLSVWLTFRLARRFLSPAGSLLATFLLAASPFFLINSGSLLSHTASLFLTLAFTIAWLDSFTTGSRVPRGLATLTAGLSLGLLALTRPFTAAAFAIPFGVHGIWILIRGGAPERKRLLGIALLAMALSSLVLLWQFAVTGSPLLNPYTLWWPYDRIGFGPGIGASGYHTIAQSIASMNFSLDTGSSDLFGWPTLSYLLIPFGLIALRRDRRAWLVVSLPFVLVAAYLLYWVGAWLYGPRYYFEGLPAAVILSAAGAGWLAGKVNSHRWSSRLRFLAVGVAIGTLVAGNLVVYLPLRFRLMTGLFQVHAEDLLPFQTPAAHRLPPTLVIVYPHRDWIEYGRLLDLSSPALDSHFIFIINQGDKDNLSVVQAFPDRYIWPYDPDKPTLSRPGSPQ